MDQAIALPITGSRQLSALLESATAKQGKVLSRTDKIRLLCFIFYRDRGLKSTADATVKMSQW